MSSNAPNTLYSDQWQSLECLHCLDAIELRRSTYTNPEVLMQVREQYEIDHSKCHEYRDAAKAQAAREFRKEGDRRKLHEDRRKALTRPAC
jgi:hypothetical protein